VATLIETFALLVGIALCVGALISSARAREFGGVIFCAIFAAVLAAALVGLLLHPAEVQQQAEKREGWNVFWLGRHVAIELFSDDATVTVYGPYCD
jgi:hypothetical protein